MTNIASPWKRLIAGIIDGLVYANLLTLMFFRITVSSDLVKIMDNLLYLVLYLLLGTTVVSLLNIALTASAGGSVGKLLTGLKVVRPDNRRISFWRAVLRNHIGYFVSGLAVWAGFFWIFKDEEHRGWHDMIADTYVVSKRQSGIITGLLALIILAYGCVFLIKSTVKQAGINMPLYRQFFTDIKTELSPTPTPAPTPIVEEQ
jgi:uncharacterized RDD family membrane protein YckC